jgi:hypothetical protein
LSTYVMEDSQDCLQKAEQEITKVLSNYKRVSHFWHWCLCFRFLTAMEIACLSLPLSHIWAPNLV